MTLPISNKTVQISFVDVCMFGTMPDQINLRYFNIVTFDGWDKT